METGRKKTLFAFRPDPEAVRKRMIREAGELYRMGLEKKRHQPVHASADGLLEKVYLYPTFRCPLRCPYCYAEGGTRDSEEMSGADLTRITREAVEAGYRAVVTVGGEPLVYHDLNAYLEGLKGIERGNTKFVLRTSFAFPVKDSLMRTLCQCYDEIVVSVDGTEKTHDAVRGKGTWRHATENIRRALDMGGKIAVNAVLDEDKKNGEDGEFLRSFCRENGIEKLVMQSPVPMGRALGGRRMPYYEWRSVNKASDSVVPSFSCGLGRSLYVQPDGKVFPCFAWCEKEHQVGDLSVESLKDILERGELLALINSGVDTNEKCKSCEVRYFCGGMCKIWVDDKTSVDSGNFDCASTKARYLRMLREYGIIGEDGSPAAEDRLPPPASEPEGR